MEQFLLGTAFTAFAWIIATAWRDMRPFRALLRLYGRFVFHAGIALSYGCIAILFLRDHWRWLGNVNHWPNRTELQIGALIGTCLFAAPVYLIAILVIVERVKTEAEKEPE